MSPPSTPMTATPELLRALRSEFRTMGSGRFDLVKDEEAGIALLTINNFAKRNSLSGFMMAQMDEVLTELESWTQGKAVILHGSGGFFSSGADLTTVRQIFDEDGGRRMNILMQDNMRRLERLPLISAAVVEGKAIGGGAEISTACDFRLMTSDSEIGFVQIRMGITAGWGGGSRLVRLIGPAQALQLLAGGRRMSASECLSIGLVDHVLPNTDSESVLQSARDWLSQFTCSETQPLRACKQIVTSAKLLPLDQALESEKEVFAETWGAPAHRRAMQLNIKHK